jgi:8-oxo-dGTP pyrophosphatase MutT (NUDIX family)
VPGLQIRVRPTGAMSWVVLKRAPGGGKLTRVTLGRVGEVSLAIARDKAREAIAAVRQGVDVNAEKRRERAVAREAEEETGYRPGSFGYLAERFIALECAAVARGHEVAGIIRKYLVTAWGREPLDGLRRHHLTELLDPIVDSGKLQQVHKVRELALRVVNWAIDRGDIEINTLPAQAAGVVAPASCSGAAAIGC